MSVKSEKIFNASLEMRRQRFVTFVKRYCLPIICAILFVFITLLLLQSVLQPVCHCFHVCSICLNSSWGKALLLLDTSLLLLIVISICNKLTNRYILLRKERNITICQIIILVAIGIWILGAILILNVQKDTASATALTVIGGVLTWIFQDRIKGAFAFIDFRRNRLLNIDDWIQIPKLGVDGEIKKVTLTTVTLYNWDTTTSTIPISALQSEHFINLQNMSKGKTYGRRMFVEFTIDTSWIHPIDADEVVSLLSDKHNIKSYLSDGVKEGDLNIHLYRLYIYHWLMDNSHVSQRPRLLVRWIEQKESGMVFQVYAFLIDYDFSAFEWQKAQIIEHIIESMGWFGLRLYQSPSAFDASNSNIFMAQAPATYKIKEA